MSRILLQYAIVSYTTLYTDAGFAVSSYYAIQQRKQCSLQLHRRTKNAAACAKPLKSGTQLWHRSDRSRLLCIQRLCTQVTQAAVKRLRTFTLSKGFQFIPWNHCRRSHRHTAVTPTTISLHQCQRCLSVCTCVKCNVL